MSTGYPSFVLLEGDCRDVFPLASVRNEIDVMITDPPYSPRVHAKAVSCGNSGGVFAEARKRDLGFAHIDDDLQAYISECAANVARWSVIYSDIEGAHAWRAEATSRGAHYIRTLAWIRWSMPQLSGDRPPSGREDLLIFHAPVEDNADLVLFYGHEPGRKAWNGPGNLTHLTHKVLRGDQKHKTEKPLDQALDLVNWFSAPGEAVYDPCMGSGTIGLACKILGRRFVGVEQDPIWYARARDRLMQATLSKRDQLRWERWTHGGGGILDGS